ncbi:hypothetical protein AB5I41_23965 [Sphingomonas sp. MMS24-JH45]
MSDVPTTIRAIDPAGPGEPEVLALVERPVPAPKAGEVLVRVAAAGSNRPDVMQRRGLYPPPPGAPSIPGSRSRARWWRWARARSRRCWDSRCVR